LELRSIEAHLAASFGAGGADLAAIAAELHAKRGGPPGPATTATRFITEDIPFGLVFTTHLARIADVPCPATKLLIDAVAMIAGPEATTGNDLVGPLRLEQESRAGLLMRVA
jgi:opine dehydrogenase